MTDTRGLHRKYTVKRTDNRDTPGLRHEDCEYFVLDLTHDRFALDTILHYAELCEEKHPALARDLRKVVNRMAVL